jgi:hypothetical protein
MKPKDLLDSLEVLLTKLVRPAIVILLWLGLLAYFGERSISPDLLQKLGDTLLQVQRKLLPSVGLQLELWQLALCALLLVALVFDKIIQVLWPFFPWQLSWSSAAFWQASKTVEIPARAIVMLKLDSSMALSQIDSQMQIAFSKLEKDHPLLVSQRFDAVSRKFRTWARLYAALGASSMLGVVAGVAALATLRYGARPLPILTATLVVLLLLVLVRIPCEILCERMARDRQLFLFEHLDTEHGRRFDVSQLPLDVRVQVTEQVAERPAPGFPYGRLWLLHWLRQIPGCGSLGAFPWRRLDETALRSPEFRRPVASERGFPIASILPSGIAQRACAKGLHWLWRRGLIENGGPLLGGEIQWSAMLRAEAPLMTPTRHLNVDATSLVGGADLYQVLTGRLFRLYFNPPRYKHIQFEAGGRIGEGRNDNEATWRVVDNHLELVQADGSVHNRFAFDLTQARFVATGESRKGLAGQYIVAADPIQR